MKAPLALLIAVALASSAFAESQARRYRSPDQQLYATIRRGNTPESGHVDVYARSGRLITAWGFGGPAGRPRRVLRAAWSPDSELFVFTVTSSPPRPRFTKFAFVRSASAIREME